MLKKRCGSSITTEKDQKTKRAIQLYGIRRKDLRKKKKMKRRSRKSTETFDCSCFLLKYPGCEPNIWIIIVSMPPIDQIKCLCYNGIRWRLVI